MVGSEILPCLCFIQSFLMHQQALSSTTFRQRKLGFGSFRVLAVTLSCRCGSWKRRRATLSLTILGRRSVTYRTAMQCQSLFQPYSHTLHIDFDSLPWTLLVKVRQVNRRLGSTPGKPYRQHLRLKCSSDLSIKQHWAFDGRYGNFQLH